MAIHTVAFHTDAMVFAGASQFTEIPAIQDQTVQITSANRVILSQNMAIMAGFAGCEYIPGTVSPKVDPGTLRAARVSAPSLRKIVSPYITPTSASLPASDDPAMMSVVNWPWKVCAQEEISIEVNISNTVGPIVGLLWFEDKRDPAPAGENFWIRATISVAAGAAPAGWQTPTAVSFDQTLAAGTYAVIGFVYKGVDTYAARLVFDRQVWRPGTLAIPSWWDDPPGQRTHNMFYDGSLGVLGRFESYSPPRFEVFRPIAALTDITAEAYLRIVRLGGPGCDDNCPPPSAGGKADYR